MLTMLYRCIGIVLLIALLTGCQTGQNPLSPGSRGGGDPMAWPFWPEKMRIHPLTRVVVEENPSDQIVEARIEFTDGDEHVSKAYGYLRIELFNTSSLGQPISGWNIDLRDIAFNAQRFDEVSRTYLFRLRVEDGAIPEQPLLRVQFHSVNGVDLEAEHRIRR